MSYLKGNCKKLKGQVTLPTEIGMDKEIAMLYDKWGCDAVRDCDGTKLPDEIKKLAEKVYSTFFPTRGDQAWATEHKDQAQELYLMSEYNTAAADTLEIDIMAGYFDQQFQIDTVHDPKEWWEVIDRTTGEIIDPSCWEFDKSTGKVIISNTKKYHNYTVGFLVYMVWDPTQMFNHITNNWGDRPHEISSDICHEETRKNMLKYLEDWLNEHPDTDVVRFTTFFYHFTLIYNQLGMPKFFDWFGYGSSISPIAMEKFEEVKGYKLRPEDIIDEGYYNNPFRIPSKHFLDYMDYQQAFVAAAAKECADIAHRHGKEAMMFLGDNWIGTEPFGKHFKKIGLDAVVGSVSYGAQIRMLSEIPGLKYTEARFMPYFFPDVFFEGGDPLKELNFSWLAGRRAIARKPVDRMGYGGYPSLALKFPEFVERVGKICDEFREIYSNIDGDKPYSAPFKVAVLNCWGKLRAWYAGCAGRASGYKAIYSSGQVEESLCGMPFEVEYISFDDIKENGIPEDIGVIINVGAANTAWSGGANWLDETVVSRIREFVHNGGGFIGIGEPTACQHQGKYFQLSDILGVERELGYYLNYPRYGQLSTEEHFIMKDVTTNKISFGEEIPWVYGNGKDEKILSMSGDYVQVAANSYGKGRSAYFSGFEYEPENNRLLLRAIYWVAGKENEMEKWYSSNINTECHAYLSSGKFMVLNNSYESQDTVIYYGDNDSMNIKLEPMECRWFEI
ncbi:1,3-beta-galactosyl-N-acetylhexosamine phosphorylase [Clostridium sp. YIM B02515]|uniref:1,3-beta-galactosyl-N-acetylhexosamine phosphorylase n=1 Tax=Clostridium rhizosphaerae TaxID=2803861 RepID=A0ABS1T663_9CLOT|nr:1,3-beta-galactosyl-N-acetylhexosamine phosphorylase [Clostridium rhizosphaerae]